ncbi:polysaccharide deacetylase family protein [Bacillus aerolatus]|nr:polysaccharide deacetylase family protein [Bacillus aerolatus]
MIALTFDDGPDPIYTPLLLELLEQHHAKATFFVVGSKARAFPNIVQDIQNRGHTIGLHNDVHLSNWLLPPFLFKRQLKKAQASIQKITGEQPMYYRPPWGHFNLFTLSSSQPLQTVMWTAIPGDWKANVNPPKLASLLKEARKSGAIITLHDSGTTLGADVRAPENTLKALEIFLADEKSADYQFVTVHTILNPPARGKE